MKPGKLLTLVVVAVVLVILAVWSTRRQQAVPPSAVGKPLLPRLDIETVARVEIARQGAPVTIVRGNDGWTVTNLFGYPADVTKLQGALLKLTEQKIGEVARGINIDTNATLVDLQDAAGRPLVTVRLGSRSPASARGARAAPGRYAAVAGDSSVYLVKDVLEEFDAEPREWVNSQLLNLTASDIQTIQIRAPTGDVQTLTREAGSMQLQGIATNEEFDAGKSYGLESVFSYLNFSGVADPKLDSAQLGMGAASRGYSVKMKNGDEYTAKIGGTTPGGDRYVAMTAALAPPGTNATAVAEQAARKADLDQKFAKWTYLVSAATAENMTRTRSELVKPKVVDTNSTATASVPATAAP